MNDTLYYTYERFEEKLLIRLNARYGDEYAIEVKETIKNNDQIHHGLIIRKQGINIAPTIYIDAFYDSYINGKTFASICDDIDYIYKRHCIEQDYNISNISDYTWVKNRLGIKLINRDMNRKRLSDIPYVSFADLAIVFEIIIEDKRLSNGSIMINNSLLDVWNISIDTLKSDAISNAKTLHPPFMMDIVDSIIDDYRKNHDDGTPFAAKEIEEYEMHLNMFRDDLIHIMVLTNDVKYYGASVIAYPGMLEEIGESVGTDYIVIPSSVHEVIIITAEDGRTPEEISLMVMEVNQTNVSPEEVLASHCYKYHKATNWLEPIVLDERENWG